MKITDALLGEHGLLYTLFDHVDAALPRAATLAEVQQLTALVSAALVSHARVEEALLFPALDATIGSGGPLTVMRLEHEEIDEAFEDAAAATSCEDAADALARAIRIARPHFLKEESILFPLAESRIDAAELERLGTAWAGTRKVAVAVRTGPMPMRGTVTR